MKSKNNLLELTTCQPLFLNQSSAKSRNMPIQVDPVIIEDTFFQIDSIKIEELQELHK